MLIGLVTLFYVLGASISRLTGRLAFYATQLNGQVTEVQNLLDTSGLSNVDLASVIKSSQVLGALGTVLSGVSGFLSSLFLILMIMLFLLSEGPAMMSRLRASVGEDHAQVARLAYVGEGVVRQFGLRAIVNLVTAAGITLLLLLRRLQRHLWRTGSGDSVALLFVPLGVRGAVRRGGKRGILLSGHG